MSNKVRYLCGCEADGDLVAFHCPTHLDIISDEKVYSYSCGCRYDANEKSLSKCSKHLDAKETDLITEVKYACGCHSSATPALVGYCSIHDQPIVSSQLIPKEKESVNHPPHYGGADNPYEVIKVLEAWELDRCFLIGNCIKYLARAKKKGNELEDYKKALWYLNYKIQNLEKQNGNQADQ